MKIAPFLTALGLVVCLGVTAGCATLTKGRKQPITIESLPAGATVLIDDVDRGRTPLKVSLLRTAPHKIVLEKEGFRTAYSGVFPVATAEAAGKVRWGIDQQTGALNDLAPAAISVKLIPASLPYSRSGDLFAQLATKVVEADDLLAAGKISPADHQHMVEQIVVFYSTK